MKSGKMLKCIDNDGGRCFITPGKYYTLIQEDDYFRIKNDKGDCSEYRKERFIVINKIYELW